jgi:polysaccharide biosynthesis transport protein
MERFEWEEDSSDLGYGRLLGVLWRRRFWLGGVFLGVLALAIPLALLRKPLYMSQMELLVESNYQSKDDSNSNDTNGLEQEFADFSIEMDYATQLKLMRSSYLLEKVLKKLGIQSLDYLNLQNSDTELASTLLNLNLQNSDTELADIIEELKESLSVSQVLEENEETSTQDNAEIETKIIQIQYLNYDSVNSRRILEAIKEVYLEYNLEQQEKRLRDGLAFIEKQIPEARKELIAVEDKLTQLRRENNLVSPQRESEAIEVALNNIQLERADLKAQKEQTKGNYGKLQQQLGLSAENSIAIARLNQSSRYKGLLDKLQQIEIELADKQARFTENNPVVQDLLAQKDSQKTLLLTEVKQILGEIPPKFAVQLESLLKQGELVNGKSDVNAKSDFIATITQSQANLTGLEERDVSLAQTESELKQKFTQFPDLIARYDNLTQEADLKRNAVQRLLSAKQELEIELSRGAYNWQVIESPQLGIQVAPSTIKDILLSLVVASFLGGTTAFIREVLDDRLYNSGQIKEKIAFPLLGSTPGLPLAKRDRFVVRLPFVLTQQSSLTDVVAWQPFRESLDLIYENLQRLGSSFAFKSLAVTSAVAGEGKSTLVLGLAWSIARHQNRVLVIDADLRSPSVHQKLEIQNDSGLTDLLQDITATASPNIQQVAFGGENIYVLTSGSKTTDPVKLLSSPKFKQLIDELEAHYDLILVDTSPVLGMVDAIKVAACCGGTVMVTRLNQVTAPELMEASNMLGNYKVLGVLANDSPEVTAQYQKQPQYLLPQEG